MEKIGTEKSPFSKIDHVGVVIRDMDKAIEFYQSLGIGPFEQRETDTLTDKMMYGKPADFKLKIATAHLGSIDIELIQPVEGAHVHEEFLESKGEGIHHVAFSVDDIDKETAKLVDKGLKVILSARRPTGGGAYFDTRKVGGVIFELIQRPPE